MAEDRSYAFEGAEPQIDPDAHVCREATLVGDVTVEAGASIWPGVVLRGDAGPVRIGENSHVGDNAVLHASTVGDRVMIGHGAVLNETTVGDGALIGFNSTVGTDTEIGERSIVAAGTVVPEGLHVPAESFARGVPARVTPLSESAVRAEDTFARYSSGAYGDLADRHDELFGK